MNASVAYTISAQHVSSPRKLPCINYTFRNTHHSQLPNRRLLYKALSRTATTEHATQLVALQSFLDWLIANGVEGLSDEQNNNNNNKSGKASSAKPSFAKKKIGVFIKEHSSGSLERGIAAVASIRKGESFARIPLKMALTDDPDDEESNNLVGRDAPWSVRLACKLLRHHGLGDQSPWYPYVQVLPRSVPSPLTSFTWEDIRNIGYSEMGSQIDGLHHLSSSAWSSLPSTAIPTDTIQQEQFEWALSLVHSRTFGTAGRKGGVGVRMMVPLVDMLNHSGDREYYDDNNQNNDSSSKNEIKIISTDNVRWDIVSKIGGEFYMILTATRDISIGEELLLSYGERSNDDFFLHYGFVPPRNVHDDVYLFKNIEEAIDWHMAKYIPLGQLTPSALQQAIMAAYVAATSSETRDIPSETDSLGSGNDFRGLDKMSESEAERVVAERNAIKLGSRGRVDGRLIAAFASLHGTARLVQSTTSNTSVSTNTQDHLREAVAARAAEILKDMFTDCGLRVEVDLQRLAAHHQRHDKGIHEKGDTDGHGDDNDDDEHGFVEKFQYYSRAIAQNQENAKWRDFVYGTGQNPKNNSNGGGLSNTEATITTTSTTGTLPFSSYSEYLVTSYRAYKAMILWDAILLSSP